MAVELTQQYSPKWAPHVEGRYSLPEHDPETGRREEQRVEATCGVCGARYKNVCRQGMPRLHVLKFARVHLHRHPLAKGVA